MNEPDKKPKLDLSVFHPISDHWPFTRYCRQYYGGGFRHLYLAWVYRWRPKLASQFWFRWARCPFSSHRWMTTRKNTIGVDSLKELGAPSDYEAVCQDCLAIRPATEDEWF